MDATDTSALLLILGALGRFGEVRGTGHLTIRPDRVCFRVSI